jgi:hypothetical protein
LRTKIRSDEAEPEGVGGFVEAMARQQNKSKDQVVKEFFEHARPSLLLKRFATVDEVAALATYVASKPSSATNARRCGSTAVWSKPFSEDSKVSGRAHRLI